MTDLWDCYPPSGVPSLLRVGLRAGPSDSVTVPLRPATPPEPAAGAPQRSHCVCPTGSHSPFPHLGVPPRVLCVAQRCQWEHQSSRRVTRLCIAAQKTQCSEIFLPAQALHVESELGISLLELDLLGAQVQIRSIQVRILHLFSMSTTPGPAKHRRPIKFHHFAATRVL